jgi:hypothetical protein
MRVLYVEKRHFKFVPVRTIKAYVGSRTLAPPIHKAGTTVEGGCLSASP